LKSLLVECFFLKETSCIGQNKTRVIDAEMLTLFTLLRVMELLSMTQATGSIEQTQMSAKEEYLERWILPIMIESNFKYVLNKSFHA